MEHLEKRYPINYPHDVLKIISAMSMNRGRNVRIMGSMALRSQLYAADYDCYETVELYENTEKKALEFLSSEFPNIIKRIQSIPNCFITDIKAGSVKEWQVIPDNAKIENGKVINLNINKCRRKIEQLEKQGVLTQSETDSYLEKLTTNISPAQFVIIKKDIRPNIIRWTPADIEKGYKTLKDGRKYTLDHAFSSQVITKLDLIGWVQGNRFAEFSMIYKFVNRGKPLNLHSDDVEQALKENILYYSITGRWFKVAKRMFSYARFHDDELILKQLTPILNSNIGRLYVILSDIETILLMLDLGEKLPLSKIYFELDQLRGRFANIYSIPDFLDVEFHLINMLEDALKSIKTKDYIGIVQDLNEIAIILLNIINDGAEQELINNKLLPLHKRFLL